MRSHAQLERLLDNKGRGKSLQAGLAGAPELGRPTPHQRMIAFRCRIELAAVHLAGHADNLAARVGQQWVAQAAGEQHRAANLRQPAAERLAARADSHARPFTQVRHQLGHVTGIIRKPGHRPLSQPVRLAGAQEIGSDRV